MATKNNPNFEFGKDPYTGPDVTSQGKVINKADGSYVEGGVRYIWTGEEDFFRPEGGWSDTPEQLASDDPYEPGGELNPLDEDDEPLYRRVLRADGSRQPGSWSNNPDYYTAPIKPADFGTSDAQGNPKYLTGKDRKGATTYTLNPDFNSGKKNTGGGDPSAAWGDAMTQWQSDAARQNASSVLGDLLRRWGLSPALQTTIEQAMIDGVSDIGIGQLIRETESYKARFPGMATRFKAGLPAISEQDYLDLERDYTALSRQSGFAGILDRQEMGDLIGGDVSAQEFQTRITLAEAAVTDADPETKRLLREFYNINDQDLVGYYLDPVKSSNLFEERRRLEAAGLAATTMDVIGDTPNLNALQVTAEGLADAGIQQREIQQRLGQRRGTTSSLIGSEGMTGAELAAAEFGLDSESSIELNRLLQQRNVPFGGQSGLLVNERGASGLGSAR
jgi:hypothetical protein